MTNPENECSTVFLERFLADPKNEEAYGKFARKYGPRIKARCQERLRLQDADADDLTAEILLRFFEGDRLEAFIFSTRAKFDAWLRRIVERACFDFIRCRQRRVLATWSLGNTDAQEALLTVPEEVTRAVGTVCAEDRALVDQARIIVRDQVEETVWVAFTLFVDEELPAKEVAARLGLNPAQVYAHASKVKMLLRLEVQRITGV